MARYGGLSLSNVLGFYLKRIRFLDCGYRCEGSPQCRRQYFMSNPSLFGQPPDFTLKRRKPLIQ